MRTLRLALICLLAVALPSSADVSPGYVQPFAKTDMVAAANPLAAQAGLEMMRAGGSAVDAVATMFFTLSVTYPVAAGLGSGGICLVRDASGVPMRSASAVSAGIALDIEFADGHVSATAMSGGA